MTIIELRQQLLALKQSAEAKDFNRYFGQGATDALKNFTETVTDLLTLDMDGNLPILNKESQQKVFQAASLLQDTVKPSRALIAFSQANPDIFVSDRTRITEIAALFASLDASKGMTLEEAVKADERICASVSGNLEKMGGNSNSRNLISIPTGNNERVNGFYTEGAGELDLDPDRLVQSMLIKAAAKYPKDTVYQSFIAKMLSPGNPYGPGILTVTSKFDPNNNYDLYDTDKTRDFGKVGYDWNEIIKSGFCTTQESANYLANNHIQSLLKDIYNGNNWDRLDELGTKFLQYGTGEHGIKAENGSPITLRNVAMSRVATLLGRPELIARSIPVTVERDGVKSVGVFMEQAKGDTYPMKNENGNFIMKELHESKFAHMPTHPFKPSAFKDMADIEIIDYLCGNVDRHQGNLTYVFDDSHHIVGVQGIDNDLSFGTVYCDKNDCKQNGTPLGFISVMTEQMSETIQNLSTETLKSVLSDTGLKTSEIEAAAARLTQLKDYLLDSLTQDDELLGNQAVPAQLGDFIHVMTEDDWTGASLQDLVNFGNGSNAPYNIFYNGVRVENLYRKVLNRNVAEVEKELHFAEASTYRDLDTNNLRATDASIAGIIADMNKSVTMFHRCKSDFKSILTTGRELADFLSPRADGTTPDVVNNPVDGQKYLSLLEKLSTQVNSYKERKNLEINTGVDTRLTGKNRLALADKLSSLVSGQITAFKDATLKDTENRLDEAFMATVEARKLSAKMEIISDALVEQIISNGSTMEKKAVKNIVDRGVTLDAMVDNGNNIDALVRLARENPEDLFNRYVETNRRLQENRDTPDALEAKEEELVRNPAKQNEPENPESNQIFINI